MGGLRFCQKVPCPYVNVGANLDRALFAREVVYDRFRVDDLDGQILKLIVRRRLYLQDDTGETKPVNSFADLDKLLRDPAKQRSHSVVLKSEFISPFAVILAVLMKTFGAPANVFEDMHHALFSVALFIFVSWLGVYFYGEGGVNGEIVPFLNTEKVAMAGLLTGWKKKTFLNLKFKKIFKKKFILKYYAKF